MADGKEHKPETDEAAVERFIAGVDVKEVQNELWTGLNAAYSKLTHLVLYKHHLLIYKLVKQKIVRAEDLADAAGYTRARVYKIIQDFEAKEIERMSNEDD